MWLCGVWICHQVGHVRQCAIWKNVLICFSLPQRACLIKRARNLLFFTLNFEPTQFIRQFVGKMKSGCPECSEKKEARNFWGPGRADHPVLFSKMLGVSSSSSSQRSRGKLMAGHSPRPQKTDIATSPPSKTRNQKAYPMCSARNQSASYKRCATSSCTIARSEDFRPA